MTITCGIKEDAMDHEKEVYFHLYCPKCKNKDVEESDPYGKCNDCLNEPVNTDSHKPLYFEEVEK